MMEEQNTWKGHTFTMMIFGGIVVLCAIFFVLGMLVGRIQSVKLAMVTAEAATTKPASKEPLGPGDERAEPRLPEAADRIKPPAAEPAARVEAAPPRPAPKMETVPVSAVSLQVGAWKKQSEAEKQLTELKKKGFGRAFILSPGPGDHGPLYRVQ